MGRCRKLYDEVRHNLYSSPTTIKVGYTAHIGEVGNTKF